MPFIGIISNKKDFEIIKSSFLEYRDIININEKNIENLKNIKFQLTIRTRRDGDIIAPFGMSGTMKLKKYMNARGIPRHNRDKMYLLCSGNEVLWALGIGLNSKIGVVDKPTHVLEWSQIYEND